MEFKQVFKVSAKNGDGVDAAFGVVAEFVAGAAAAASLDGEDNDIVYREPEEPKKGCC